MSAVYEVDNALSSVVLCKSPLHTESESLNKNRDERECSSSYKNLINPGKQYCSTLSLRRMSE